tara:strand:+ start:4741 stop:6972 length:2232 start_codon:yes stop_codon:yes gene_type:complete
MKKIFFIILSFIFTLSILKAEMVKDISINGNKRISKETIKLYGGVKKNKDYKEKDLNKILNNLYKTNFFEDVKVTLQNNILRIDLKEFPTVNQLIIIGEKSNKYKKQIKKVISTKEKGSLIKSQLARDINLIEKLYSSLGYNLAKAEAKLRKIDDTNFDLLIEINRGNQTKISEIKFIGNQNIRSMRLRDIIASEEDKFWKVISKNTILSENLINLDIRLLKNYYKSVGFYDVDITSNLAELNDTGAAELVYSIDEGIRYTINKITTNVDPIFDNNIFFPLKKTYDKYIGEYYSPFKIKKILEQLDELIDDNNLQFVEHNVQESIEGSSINITFNVFEGEKTVVERINILGNKITNEDVIRGELLLDEGDPFTDLNLDKSIAEIKARNIFRKVNYEIKEGSKNNLKIIDIIVEEQPTGEISAGAGVGTSGGTLTLGIKENNWLGEGKIVGFDIQVDEESLLGTLKFINPNYDFLGNSLRYSFSSEDNDKPDQGYENTVIGASVGTSFEQYRDIRVSLGLAASYDDLRTVESASSSLKKQSGNYSDLRASYGFSRDKRNRAFMPTSGSITSFSQSLPVYADKASISNTFSSSMYKSFNDNVVGASKFYLSAINGLGSDDVRLSKRKYLSTTRLRGFEKGKVGPVDGNDHIGGNYAAALNFEANLPNFLPENYNTDISLFLDFGSVWGADYDSSIDESNDVRSSTGLSANWMSPIGPLSFVLSQNISKADTDETQSFSFNIGTTF